jgi:NAD(P)-dependent dehydrogenase (short-subunit alcohol dehydrogenase family)
MRIFVAGASGAIGKRLVPLLVENGHAFVGSTGSPEQVGSLRASGAEPAVVDLLNPEAVTAAVRSARPEVVAHARRPPSPRTPRRIPAGWATFSPVRQRLRSWPRREVPRMRRRNANSAGSRSTQAGARAFGEGLAPPSKESTDAQSD